MQWSKEFTVNLAKKLKTKIYNVVKIHSNFVILHVFEVYHYIALYT